jgi:hypothetical protein
MQQLSGMVVVVCVGSVLAACSLRYGTDDLRGEDAGDEPDSGMPDGAPEADADPAALDFRILPAELFEGEGSALVEADLDLVRPVPIVLRGQNLSDDMTVVVDGAGFDRSLVDEIAVSDDGTWAALALRIPIRPELAQGMFETLELRGENAAGDVTRGLTVRGLDSFEHGGGLLDTGTTAIAARYSHVVLEGAIAARGAAPVRLIATAGIAVSGSLRADASGAAPGAGGCAGGAIATAAPCGDGAGGGAGPLSGGGGGGFGAAGSGGTGDGGAGGGQATGDGTLVPLPPAEGSLSRGSGGGGGGQLLNLTGGQPGGGGGGVVELTTGAVLRLGGSALVSANGVSGGISASCLLGGGSGGAGSGGAILLRAGASLAAGQGAQVRAAGGAATGTGNCIGGAGGAGRIRIDSPDLGDLVDEPAAQRGAMFSRDVPVVTRDEILAVSMRGAPGATYDLYLGESDEPETSVTADGSGLGTADVALEPGFNRICISGSAADELSYPEARNCLTVAHVP